jgi:hypothetical protein
MVSIFPKSTIVSINLNQAKEYVVNFRTWTRNGSSMEILDKCVMSMGKYCYDYITDGIRYDRKMVRQLTDDLAILTETEINPDLFTEAMKEILTTTQGYYGNQIMDSDYEVQIRFI